VGRDKNASEAGGQRWGADENSRDVGKREDEMGERYSTKVDEIEDKSGCEIENVSRDGTENERRMTHYPERRRK